jgi:hypothetical protein
MFHNILTIGIKDGSFDVSISPWIIVLGGLIIIALLSWRIISKRIMSDINLEISLGNIGKVSIKPNYEVRQIAHKAWVELKTRKAGLPIDKDNDVISDVYESWYNLFGEIRTLTRDVPASKLRNPDTKKLVELLIDTLNEGLRPHLTRWQAQYRWWYEKAVTKSDYESLTPQDIQNKYPKYNDLVEDMLSINQELVQYTEEIKKLADG